MIEIKVRRQKSIANKETVCESCYDKGLGMLPTEKHLLHL